MNLDSLYAITARPPKQVGTFKRDVKKVSDSGVINADSHEAPQSQLPPESLDTAELSKKNSPDESNKAQHNSKRIDIEI